MSLRLTLDEYYLVSASTDCSVRIWDLRTNKPVGEPLWHDDEVWSIAISSDRQRIPSSGLDTKIYLWDFEAALKQSSNQDQNVHDNNPQSNVKERISSSEDIFDVSTKSQPRLNNASSSKYGDNFWRSDPHKSTGVISFRVLPLSQFVRNPPLLHTFPQHVLAVLCTIGW